MADLKISALPAASVALAGTEVLPIVQSSATKQVTVANLTAGRAVATGALTVTGDATLSTGNLVQGTAAKGINFTANTPAAGMTSQLLNWYEEGTWTFAITTATGSVTMNASANKAWYTRVGKLVTIGGQVNVASVSSPTGYIAISIPFPTTNITQTAGYNSGSVIVSNSVSKTARDFVCILQPSQEMRIFLGDVSTISSANANAQQLQAGTNIFFQMSYYTP
jgi:hypothetical protein